MSLHRSQAAPRSVQEAARLLATGFHDRRAFFKRAAGLALALPVLGGLGLHAQTSDAQDENGREMEGTPSPATSGPIHQSPSTGDD